PAAALLVVGGRGAVLHRLAAAAGPADLVAAAPRAGDRDRGPARGSAGDRGAVVPVVGAPDWVRPGPGVLRVDHAAVGAGRRCIARRRSRPPGPAAAHGSLVHRVGGADRDRAGCLE